MLQMNTAGNLQKYVKRETRRLRETLYALWHLKLKSSVPIIVYQMGKVGSTSIKESLKQHGVQPVFHVHRMNPQNIGGARNAYLRRGQIPPYEKTGIYLHKKVCQSKSKAKFITIVREPISRNISAFFQNSLVFAQANYHDENPDTEGLIRLFISDYSHQVPLTWFDIEIKQVLGIDVYQYPFPKEQGYMTIREGNFEVLILKLELPDSTKEKAVAEFLGLNDFNLSHHNVARHKNYSQAYEHFKEAISLPYSYVEKMCASKYTRHFYNSTEIDAIWSQWCHND